MNEFAPIAELMPDTFRILWRENVSSTNDDLRALALKGTPEGLVLVCEEQAAGRGRRGAAWFSPKGESLAFSVLLRPIAPKSMWCRLSLAAGLAVAEAFLPRGGFSAAALCGVAMTIAASPSISSTRRRAVAREFGIGM